MNFKRIRNTWKVIVCVLLAALLAGSGAVCAKTYAAEGGSRVQELLEGISEETGLHLDCSMEQDGVNVSMNMYEKGDDFYAEIIQDGFSVVLIADADYLAVLDPETMTYDIMEIDGDIQAQLDDIKANFAAVMSVGDLSAAAYTEGTLELDGTEYVTEIYEDNGQKAIFAFDGQNTLQAMIVDAGDGEATLKINALDGNIPEGQFLIPGDYAYVGDSTEKDTGLETESDNDAGYSEYAVFSSDVMDFSFLYNKAHTARVTDAGAAELAINGDDSLVGLFVSCVSDMNMPEVSQILEEESFNVQQKYQNAMVDLPEIDTVTIEGHTLDGMMYAYSDEQGRTVDCAYFVEVRDGRYIFFETAALRENSGAELEAMGEAMASLETDASYYDDLGFEKLAESAAAAGDLDLGDVDWEDYELEDIDLSMDDVASQIESGFAFDTDPSYLILSDENATMVYTGGTMEGANFVVERVDLEDTVADAIDQRSKEVLDFLQERVVVPPTPGSIEIGSRTLNGIEYAYSAVDGSRTIEGAEYFEEVGDEVYSWYCLYDRGDTVTYDAMKYAMQTFAVN